jgi:tRNA-modifying protein YgfZ
MFSLEGYQALRHGAGLVRRGDRGILAVSGPDRLTWLQGLLTNDVAALPIGGVCDAAYLTPQGRMITDLRVLHLADRTLLDVPASLSESLRAKLDGLLFAEDAQITDATSSHVMLDVHGPAAPPLVAETISAQASRIKASFADAPYGVPGFSVLVAPGDAGVLIAELVQRGVIETTLETLDVLRVEAGRPAFLIDMDEHTLPLEAGLGQRAISFTKGCYVGQEVIIRVMHRGHGRVAKKLVGLTLAKGELPKAGVAIISGSREIGKLTSVVWSPSLESGIALGYVHRDFADHGTPVTVVATAGNLDATVTSLPFRTN